jgi:outer membrane protein assembly factor BamB
MTESGKLYGLDADDLQPVWEATVGLSGKFISSPSVARGHVYVGSENDGLVCIGAPGQTARQVWAGALGGPGRGGNIDRQPLPDRGTYAWSFPQSTAGDATPPAVAVTAPPACIDQRVFVPLHGDRNGLVCLQDESKGTQRGKAKEMWFAAAPHGVWSSPAANDEAVFFVDGQKGDAGRRLHCLAIADGAERYAIPVDPAVAGTFVLLDDGLLVADKPGELAFFDLAGTAWWRTQSFDYVAPVANPLGEDLMRLYGEPVWCDSMVVAALDNPPALIALDRLSGKPLWRQTLETAPTASPVLRQNTVYLGTADGVAAISLTGGAPIWTSKAGRPAGGLVVVQHYLAYVNANSELVVLDVEKNGQPQLHLPRAIAGVTPLATRDTLLYAGLTEAGKPALFCCNVGGGEPRVWLATQWLGTLTASPVLANSHVYFATAGRGLVCAKGKASP